MATASEKQHGQMIRRNDKKNSNALNLLKWRGDLKDRSSHKPIIPKRKELEAESLIPLSRSELRLISRQSSLHFKAFFNFSLLLAKQEAVQP